MKIINTYIYLPIWRHFHIFYSLFLINNRYTQINEFIYLFPIPIIFLFIKIPYIRRDSRFHNRKTSIPNRWFSNFFRHQRQNRLSILSCNSCSISSFLCRWLFKHQHLRTYLPPPTTNCPNHFAKLFCINYMPYYLIVRSIVTNETRFR